MNLLAVPFIVFFTVLTVLAFALGIRRLLGIWLSATRTIIAGVIAFLLAGSIITAFGRSVPLRRGEALPALGFVILGAVIATVIGMAFLVVAEALVPSGSLPGP